MKKAKLLAVILIFTFPLVIISCSSSKVRTTAVWVNKEKLPPEPLKSVFIIAFTDNIEVRSDFEHNLAAAAEKRGLKAYKSLDIIGPVDMKSIAPVKDVFVKKLKDLNCDAIFTVALVQASSETKYVPASSGVYSPYAYGGYAGYSGYGGYGPYGGFGGYYGFAISTMSTPGYYSTDSKYFIEAKLFDLNTDELLFSIQTKATNPETISKASKQYTESIVEQLNIMNPQKK